MQTRHWRAKWDGALIEVKYQAIPFSGLDSSLGLYPTAEMLIDGVSVAFRAWDEFSSLDLEVAVRRPDGAQTPICVRVNQHPDGPGCEIRVDDEILDVL